MADSMAVGCALVLCVMARVPHRLLDATGVRGWALAVVVVVAAVTGARALARAPFTFAHALAGRTDRGAAKREWAKTELRTLVLTPVVGSLLTVPMYALLRATSAWWLLAWVMFAAVTIVGQLAMPLLMRAQTGPLVPADDPTRERVRALGARAGVTIGGGAGGGVLVGGKAGKRGCNAFVVGLGPTRRVVLEGTLAHWPAAVADQAVAHEIGHWRLGHAGQRLPLALAVQLATLAFAAWVFSLAPLLDWAGVEHAGDPRSYPLLLLLTPLLSFPARAVLAWRDRAQERAADAFALELLDEPEHFAAMLERAADEGGAPRRLPWCRRLTASHPTIDERALACTRFASTG